MQDRYIQAVHTCSLYMYFSIYLHSVIHSIPTVCPLYRVYMLHVEHVHIYLYTYMYIHVLVHCICINLSPYTKLYIIYSTILVIQYVHVHVHVKDRVHL